MSQCHSSIIKTQENLADYNFYTINIICRCVQDSFILPAAALKASPAIRFDIKSAGTNSFPVLGAYINS